MGDARRFDYFADLINREFGNMKGSSVVDVAGGKGLLQAALRQRQFNNVTSWDKRHNYASRRRFYKYGYFDFNSAPDNYNLVVGMHPDEGTDHIVCYAIKQHVPFVVCPCCIKPSALSYKGVHDYRAWCGWLSAIARAAKFEVKEFDLKIRGCSKVIMGRPSNGSPGKGST